MDNFTPEQTKMTELDKAVAKQLVEYPGMPEPTAVWAMVKPVLEIEGMFGMLRVAVAVYVIQKSWINKVKAGAAAVDQAMKERSNG